MVALDSEGLARLFDQDERKALAVLFFDDEKALDDKRVISVGPGRKEASTPRSSRDAARLPDRVRGGSVARPLCRSQALGRVPGRRGRPTGPTAVRATSVWSAATPRRSARKPRAPLLVSTLAPLGVPSRVGQKALLLVPDQPDFFEVPRRGVQPGVRPCGWTSRRAVGRRRASSGSHGRSAT